MTEINMQEWVNDNPDKAKRRKRRDSKRDKERKYQNDKLIREWKLKGDNNETNRDSK